MLRFSQAATRWLIALVVLAGSVAAYAHSYHGLVVWAARHSQAGIWAYTWPLMVDVFPVIGELALFEAALAGARLRSRLWAWFMLFSGLGISLLGNVYQEAAADLPTRLTDAVPPLAATAALGVGLGILQKVVAGKLGRPAPSFHFSRPSWLRLPRPHWPGKQAEPVAEPAAVVDVSQPVADTEPKTRPVPARPRKTGGRVQPVVLADYQAVIDGLRTELADGAQLTDRAVARRHPGMTRYTGAKLLEAASASPNGVSHGS